MGHFIFKFLRELNSATSSKMMVLAVVLALIAGFLPFVNFFTILIFIVVLILRIPIGLFLASFSFFEFIGYFLDPFFNKTGFFLLNLSFLKPVWTFFYNLPFFRWSGFNNTIVMGGLVWGSVLGIILYIVLNKSVKFYRAKVFEKLKTKKYLSWLVPTEKKGVIRITGIGFISVLAGCVILFFIFLLDPIVKYSLEFGLSHILHKKVAIKKVDTSIKNLSLNIQNMQIGDVLFKKVYAKLAWDKIVWRKYKIDDLKLIVKTDKNIYDLIKNSNKSTNNNSFKVFSALHINLPAPKDILAKQSLKSFEALKKLKKDYKKINQDLKSLKTDKYKNEFNSLNKKLNSMKNIKINTPSDLQNLIATINNIKKEADKLLKQIKKDKNVLINDKKLIVKDLQNIKLALKEDKTNIKSKYAMLKNKEYMKFVQSILKPQISKYLQLADNVYQKIKPFIKNKKKKEYIRHKGTYIKFKDKIVYPDFVLVKSNADVKTSIAKWDLKANNISDNQILLNKKALIKIKGKSKFFDVGADVSYLKKIYFNGYGNKIKLKKVNMNFADLNAVLNTKIKGVLFDENINAEISAYILNVKFDNLNKNIKKFLGDSLSKIDKFNIIIKIKGKLSSPIIKIKSDLDDIFARIFKSRINSLINKQILRAEKLLNKKVNSSLKTINLKGIDIKLNELNSLENMKNLIHKKALEVIKSKQQKSTINVIKKLLPF